MIFKKETTNDEKELQINFYPVEMGKKCEIYTTIPYMMKYLEKLCNEYPEQYQLVNDDSYSYTVRTDFKYVKPRKPKFLNEKQKANLFHKETKED
jgi:hypothetical protein